MRHYPIFVDTKGIRVLFVGAGEAIAAKLRVMLRTDASITVIGEGAGPDVILWAQQARITYQDRAYRPGDGDGIRLAIVATGDDEQDELIAQDLRQTGCLVNLIDRLEQSDFITPAIVDRDPVIAAISTSGTAPVLARKIKAMIETALPQNLGAMALWADQKRTELEQRLGKLGRRKLWERFFDSGGIETFGAGGDQAAGQMVENLATLPDGAFVIIPDQRNMTPDQVQALRHADIIATMAGLSRPVEEGTRREARINRLADQQTIGSLQSAYQDDIKAGLTVVIILS
jgi:uroporphyrin-III C-methyltransferase/precorrin-2 dehydrogenase/sirohydrochlorin ferrochelatase